MTLNESALKDIHAAIEAGEGIDLVRDLACWLMQALIDAEAADKIGADRYERSDERVTHRARYDPLTDAWTTVPAAPIELGVDQQAVWTGERLLVYAGFAQGGDAVAATFNPMTEEWTLIPNPPLGPRRDSAMSSDGSRFVVLWGGSASGSVLSDGALFDLDTGEWLVLPPSPATSGRDRHSIMWHQDRFLIIGGNRGGPLTFQPCAEC